jgi:WD40 repeat protein
MAQTKPHRSHELLKQRDDFIRGINKAESHMLKSDMATALRGLSEARAIHGYERDGMAMALLDRVACHCRRSAFRGGWHLHTIKGHLGNVVSVAISSDGCWGLSGGQDYTLRLWDLASGQCLRTFEGQSNYNSVAISPNGHWGLSGFVNALRLWDLATGQCLRTFEGHSNGVNSVAISPDGCWGLSGSRDKTLRLWDLASGQCLRTFEGHSNGVNSVAISPDGRWGLSGSEDETLKLWDLANGQCLRTFEGHSNWVTSVAFSPNGCWGVSGSEMLRLWDLASGQCLRTFEGHSGGVTSVAISQDGRWGLSGSWDNRVRLWDLASGQCLRTFEGHSNKVASVAISPDGRWGLSGSDDRTLRLWKLDWEYEFPGWADWDAGALPYLTSFLTLHCPIGPTGFARAGKPSWGEKDFKQLLYTLGCAGYGWLRREGVRRQLEKMAADWKGPPTMPRVKRQRAK